MDRPGGNRMGRKVIVPYVVSTLSSVGAMRGEVARRLRKEH